MPSAIELDLKHWVRVVPAEGKTQVVTCRSFACFRSGALAPPELSTEGTEVTTGTAFTIEGSGAWFIAKKAASTEEQLPSLLEVAPATVETINASALAENSVTAPKIKSEAVTAAKALPSTLPAAGAEKTVTAGTAGVGRKITAVHVGDGAETTIKVKHSFETEAVNVVVQKGAETKKPGANYLNAAGAGNITWKPSALSEVEVTFGTAPIAKFESFVTVFA